jgi:hypothetical protein
MIRKPRSRQTLSRRFQVLRYAEPSRSSLLPDENAYLVSDIGRHEGMYRKHLAVSVESVLRTARFETFCDAVSGNVGEATTFSWDCEDKLLETGQARSIFGCASMDFGDAKPFDLQSSSAPESLKALAAISPRMTWWSVDNPRFKTVFCAASALERLIAPHADLFSLLLSPFRSLAIPMVKVEGAKCTMVLDKDAAGLRTHLQARTTAVSGITRSDALCVGYWANLANGFPHKQYLVDLVFDSSPRASYLCMRAGSAFGQNLSSFDFRRNAQMNGRVPSRGVGPQPGRAETRGTQRATADSRVGTVSLSVCRPSSCM